MNAVKWVQANGKYRDAEGRRWSVVVTAGRIEGRAVAVEQAEGLVEFLARKGLEPVKEPRLLSRDEELAAARVWKLRELRTICDRELALGANRGEDGE